MSQSKDYLRKILNQRKAQAIISLTGVVNMVDAINDIQKNASRFSYPFMMMQASEDIVVSNP